MAFNTPFGRCFSLSKLSPLKTQIVLAENGTQRQRQLGGSLRYRGIHTALEKKQET